MLRRSCSLTFQPKASSAATTSLTLVENSEDLSYVKHQLATQYSIIFIRGFYPSVLKSRTQMLIYSFLFFRKCNWIKSNCM